MPDLTEFLLARIAEDEAAAREATPFGEARTFYSSFGAGSDDWGCYYFNVPPARVMAECEAKRRIVDLHGRDHECVVNYQTRPEHFTAESDVFTYCDTIRALALPYADHDDYREEWRP